MQSSAFGHKNYLSEQAIVVLCLASYIASSFFFLWRGLSLSEGLTAYVVRDDAEEVISRALEYQGESPLYFLIIWGLGKIVPLSEAIMRIPTIAATALSFFCMAAIARIIISKSAVRGTLILFTCAVILEPNQVFFVARPYAMALLFGMISLIAAYKSETNALYAWLWPPCLMLVPFFHPLYSLVGIPVLAFCLRHGLLHASWRWFPILLSLACTPLLADQLLSIAQKRALWSYLVMPSWGMLLTPPYSLVLVAIIAVLWLGFLVEGNKLALRFPRSFTIPFEVWFSSLWFFSAPVSCYLLSHASGASIYASKYMIWNLPGFALLAHCLLSSARTALLRFFGFVIAAGMIALPFFFQGVSYEPWKEASEVVSLKCPTPSGVALVYAGLIESANIAFIANEQNWSYLTSPASTYLPAGKHIPLPIDIWSVDSSRFLGRIISRELKDAKQVPVIVSETVPIYSSSKTRERPSEVVQAAFESLGWIVTQQTELEGISVFCARPPTTANG